MEDISYELVEGLKTIPIGIELLSLDVYVYNFLANKINLISAINISNQLSFINAIVKQMSSCLDVKVKVVDALGIYKKVYENVELLNQNFDDVIKNIANLLKTEKENKETTVYVMLGIGLLKGKLSKDNQNELEKIFSEVSGYEKTIFVFADDLVNLTKLQTEEWYRANVDDSNGIWLGEGVGDQMIIQSTSIGLEERKIIFPNMGFPIYKGSHMIIKYVTDDMEEK